MSIDEWFAFARDFNLGPGTNRVDSGPLSRAAVAASFREANHGRGSDEFRDALSFDEFRDALARCAARGFADETNARANAVVSVSSPDVTFAGSSPRGSPAATLPRDAYGRVVDVPRGKNTQRNVSPNGVWSSYASSHPSSWSASSPSLVRARARAGASSRAKLRVQGVARARLADADQVRRRVSDAVLSRRRAPRGVSLGDGGDGS